MSSRLVISITNPISKPVFTKVRVASGDASKSPTPTNNFSQVLGEVGVSCILLLLGDINN